MQADEKSFYKKLAYNLDIKQKKYSRNTKDRYTKSFVLPPPKKEVTKSEDEPAPQKWKVDASPSNLSCQEC